MASLYKLLIQVLGQDKASPALKQASRAVQGLEAAAGGLGMAIETVAGVGLAYLGKQALQAAWDMGVAGAESLRLKDSFEGLAGAAGETLVQAMKEAAGGTISATDAMLAANKGMLLELGKDVEQWADLTGIARFRARALQTDVTRSLGGIITALGQGTEAAIQNVDALFDMDTALDTYAAKVGKSADELGALERKQAIVNAFIVDGQREIAAAGGIISDYKDSIDAMNVALEEAGAALGETFAPAVASAANYVAEAVPEMATKFDLLKASIEGTISAGQLFSIEMEADKIAATQGAAAANEYRKRALGMADAVGVAAGAIREVDHAFGGAATAGYEARREILQLIPAVGDLEEAWHGLAAGVWAGTYAQLQAISVYEYRREGIVRKTEDDVERLRQINEDFLNDLNRTTKVSLDDTSRAWDDLRSTIEAALRPTSVTALDITQTAAGTYADKWDEDARRLDAIAARGFAELEAHPDWAEILKIPPGILAAGEDVLKDWARRTSDDVRNLFRPDLLEDNMDAIIAAVQAYIDREAAKELSLDIITEAVMKEGIITGEDAKKKVAAALGLDQTYIGEEAGTQFMSGLMTSLQDTSLSAEFASYMQKDIGEGSGQLKSSGDSLWTAVELGIFEAMRTTDYAHEFAMMLAPEVARIIESWNERGGQ